MASLEGRWGLADEGPSEKMRFTMGNEGEIMNYSPFFLPNVGGSRLQPGAFSAHSSHPPSLHPQASAWAVVSGGEV